jgi:hypothetical protein
MLLFFKYRLYKQPHISKKYGVAARGHPYSLSPPFKSMGVPLGTLSLLCSAYPPPGGGPRLGGPFKLSRAKFACRFKREVGIDLKKGGYAEHRRPTLKGCWGGT